jgi:hypothetical protein
MGDLVGSSPLGYWSELTLVAWGLPHDDYAIYQALGELSSELRINIRRTEDAAPLQRAVFEREAVEVNVE